MKNFSKKKKTYSRVFKNTAIDPFYLFIYLFEICPKAAFNKRSFRPT